MKTILLFTLVFSSTLSWAGPKDQFMTVKERLRISLWLYGIEQDNAQQTTVKKNRLPEELERALKKI